MLCSKMDAANEPTIKDLPRPGFCTSCSELSHHISYVPKDTHSTRKARAHTALDDTCVYNFDQVVAYALPSQPATIAIWRLQPQQRPRIKEEKGTTLMITEVDLQNALTIWGNGKVSISKAFEEDGIEKAREIASANLDSYYGYNLGPVLFKPTMASGAQTFRPTKDGALAYFCGHSEDYPLDNGFAIMGWRSMESVTSASFIQGDIAMWMGWVKLTNKDGSVTTVDKSFGYKKDPNGDLRIVLHHSSLPYQP